MEGIRVSECLAFLRSQEGSRGRNPSFDGGDPGFRYFFFPTFQEGPRGINSVVYCLNKNSFSPIEFQDGSSLDPKENDRVTLFSARCGLILFQTWTQRKPKGKRTGSSFLFILISIFNIFFSLFLFFVVDAFWCHSLLIGTGEFLINSSSFS
jgi:hypothetical protein